MKYLTEEYWESFKKIIITQDKKEKIIHDGQKFEDLIELLLKLLYKNEKVYWEKTQETHDGNKDFLGQREDGTYIWAECKNYKDKISLKVLAPTLVMAEINDIQDILVFSYSALNENTKKKLLYYADKRNKKIYYYDDLNLENLLFRFRTNIFPKYFPNYKKVTHYPEVIEPYIFSYSMPGLLNNDNIEFISSEFNVKLNELFFIGIGIINNNYDKKIYAELSFYQINDLKYLEIVDSSINMTNCAEWKKQIVLEPGEAQFYKIYFKLAIYKKNIKLPSIHIKNLNSKDASKIIEYKKITCNSLFNVPLIGSDYLNVLQELKDNTVNQSHMSFGFLYGKSGVGKSRLLQEAQSIYIREHYQILNFTLDVSTKDSLYIIREIIYFIYNLTPELVIQSLKEYQKEVGLFKADHMEIVNLLQSSSEKDLKVFIDKLQSYKYLIYEKILSQKNVILIDNIQFADSFFADFLYELCVYGKNYQRNTNFVLVVSCNQDYYCNSSVKKLRLLAEELNNQSYLNIVLHEIKGMQRNNLALGFLKQLVHVKDENSNFYLENIVKKANYIPKHIENIVQCLLNEHILDTESNYFVIKDLKKFYSSIDQLPEVFAEVFKKRFTLFQKNEKILTEEAVLLVISSIHFLGNVTKDQLNQLKIDYNVIDKLYEYGFVDQNYSKEYRFNHDLYEQFFSTTYLLENIFISHFIKEKLYNKFIFNSWQKLLILLEEENNPCQVVQTIISFWTGMSECVPYKLKKYFYTHVILYMAQHNKDVANFDEYMECSKKICLDAKNNLGINFSEPLFEMIYNATEDVTFKENSEGYQNFLYEYSENLLQGNSDKVLRIYRQQIKSLEQNLKKNYKQLARFYNRLYVFYKNKKEEKSVHKYLKKSMNICTKKHLLGLEIENLYDEGNYYLYDKNKKNALINCWSKGCSIFDKNHEELEYLTLNYYKKKIQLNLLTHEYENLNILFDEAFDYLENGTFNEQALFFYASLYYLKAIYGLVSNKYENNEIYEFIDMAGKYYVLKNNEKPYSIHFLYAKLAFRDERYQEMLYFYNNALQVLNKSNYNFENIKKILLGDVFYKILSLKDRNINCNIKKEEIFQEIALIFDHIENMTEEEIKKWQNSFFSSSLFTDLTGKDGFVF